MDTTRTTPPPPPPPVPSAPPPPRPRADPVGWGRTLLADAIDLGCVGVHATLAGMVAMRLYDRPGDGPWEALAAFLVGLAVAVVAAKVLWVTLLVLIGAGGPTPGRRVLRLPPDRRWWRAALRHVALVAASWLLLEVGGVV